MPTCPHDAAVAAVVEEFKSQCRELFVSDGPFSFLGTSTTDLLKGNKSMEPDNAAYFKLAICPHNPVTAIECGVSQDDINLAHKAIRWLCQVQGTMSVIVIRIRLGSNRTLRALDLSKWVVYDRQRESCHPFGIHYKDSSDAHPFAGPWVFRERGLIRHICITRWIKIVENGSLNDESLKLALPVTPWDMGIQPEQVEDLKLTWNVPVVQINAKVLYQEVQSALKIQRQKDEERRLAKEGRTKEEKAIEKQREARLDALQRAYAHEGIAS